MVKMGNLADIYKIYVPYCSKPLVWFVWMVGIEIFCVQADSLRQAKTPRYIQNGYLGLLNFSAGDCLERQVFTIGCNLVWPTELLCGCLPWKAGVSMGCNLVWAYRTSLQLTVQRGVSNRV